MAVVKEVRKRNCLSKQVACKFDIVKVMFL